MFVHLALRRTCNDRRGRHTAVVDLVLRRVARRWVLRQAGRGVVGFAVLGLAACSDVGDKAPQGVPSPTTGARGGSSPSQRLAWSRVDLGFVSAYVLVRGDEAAVVDTGVEGSADAIGAVLDESGPGWAGVRHVVLTHKHNDHAGSLSEVLSRSDRATGYVGAADLEAVDVENLRALADGDEVFGLQVVATPGHTPGHMAVFDPGTKLLVAGDALNNEGRLSGANPGFSEDMGAAAASVRTLAALAPATILVGHGAPVTDDAASALAELADSL
jgi:glyoxylase-like metal-dependent hydrolase (beta-lactamase superfamily II)